MGTVPTLGGAVPIGYAYALTCPFTTVKVRPAFSPMHLKAGPMFAVYDLPLDALTLTVQLCLVWMTCVTFTVPDRLVGRPPVHAVRPAGITIAPSISNAALVRTLFMALPFLGAIPCSRMEQSDYCLASEHA